MGFPNRAFTCNHTHDDDEIPPRDGTDLFPDCPACHGCNCCPLCVEIECWGAYNCPGYCAAPEAHRALLACGSCDSGRLRDRARPCAECRGRGWRLPPAAGDGPIERLADRQLAALREVLRHPYGLRSESPLWLGELLALVELGLVAATGQKWQAGSAEREAWRHCFKATDAGALAVAAHRLGRAA